MDGLQLRTNGWLEKSRLDRLDWTRTNRSSSGRGPQLPALQDKRHMDGLGPSNGVAALQSCRRGPGCFGLYGSMT